MATTHANISSIFLGNVAHIDVKESDSVSELADTLLGTIGSTTDPLNHPKPRQRMHTIHTVTMREANAGF
ncbi:MAG: hypothetical protein Q9M48_04295 [Rhodobacterales bacterium]|nr:hypothetical protein [Rhodobacterales bacterium]